MLLVVWLNKILRKKSNALKESTCPYWPEKHFPLGWVIISSIGEYPYLTILPSTRVPFKRYIKTFE